jgi:hypothetical protein
MPLRRTGLCKAPSHAQRLVQLGRCEVAITVLVQCIECLLQVGREVGVRGG